MYLDRISNNIQTHTQNKLNKWFPSWFPSRESMVGWIVVLIWAQKRDDDDMVRLPNKASTIIMLSKPVAWNNHRIDLPFLCRNNRFFPKEISSGRRGEEVLSDLIFISSPILSRFDKNLIKKRILFLRLFLLPSQIKHVLQVETTTTQRKRSSSRKVQCFVKMFYYRNELRKRRCGDR